MSQSHTSTHAESWCLRLGIDDEGRRERLDFVGFAADDATRLADLQPLIERHADKVVDAFYDNVQRFPELNALIQGTGSTVDRLRQTQRQYLLDLFCGDYGEAYFESRLRIGVMHHRIGLTPRWYLGSYSVYLRHIAPLLLRHFWYRPRRGLRALGSLNKLLSVDAQLAMDTYIHSLMDELGQVSLSRDELQTRIESYETLIGAVTRGDLTRRVSGHKDDALGRLGISLNHMVDGLAAITGKVFAASNSMLASLDQVQAALAGQTAGASEQASAVSQTTSTLEEIRATAGQTLEKAGILKEAAERTREAGDQGLETVRRTLAAMEGIRAKVETIAATITALSDQSQQIGDITAVVDGLAQQSKMLALNASIEAAKAGDAGRGFAVVADEVRDLAEQSRQSTAQVQSILEDIRKAMDKAVQATEAGTRGTDEGAALAAQSGEVVQRLTDVIHDTAVGAQQIVAAVRQQVSGVEQIGTAMGDIHRVTNQFVGATRQTAAASEELAGFAGELQELVRRFKAQGQGSDED